jgi:hypothetical protein
MNAMPRTTKTRAEIPIEDRFRSVFADDAGNVVEIDCIWCSAIQWARMPESRDGRWSTRAIGPFLLAFRPTI